MGSYSSPAFSPTRQKELVDVTAQADDIVFQVRCTRFAIALVAGPAWDGRIDIQIKRNDDTWLTRYNNAGDIDETLSVSEGSDSFVITGNPAMKYPYEIRVIVITPPSLSLTTCYISYEPPPANPLF